MKAVCVCVWGDDGFKISKERRDNTATKKKNVNLGREFKNFSDEWKNVS
jgi:hypothetical protein